MFPLIMAGYRFGFPVSSPTAFKTLSEQEYRMKPVGTGPFKFLEHVPNDRIVLVRNEHYFKSGLPYLDKVVFKILSDPMTQVSALKAGEVDMLNSVSPELVRVLERDRAVSVLSGLQTTPMVAMVQQTRPPLTTFGSGRRSVAMAPIAGRLRRRPCSLAVPLVAMAPVDTQRAREPRCDVSLRS
jgi:ABC-type transport system substrate-binding protein